MQTGMSVDDVDEFELDRMIKADGRIVNQGCGGDRASEKQQRLASIEPFNNDEGKPQRSAALSHSFFVKEADDGDRQLEEGQSHKKISAKDGRSKVGLTLDPERTFFRFWVMP